MTNVILFDYRFVISLCLTVMKKYHRIKILKQCLSCWKHLCNVNLDSYGMTNIASYSIYINICRNLVKNLRQD